MQNRRKKRKKSFIRKYFAIVGSIVGVFAFVFTISMFVYINTYGVTEYDPQKQNNYIVKEETDKNKPKKTVLNDILSVPERTNFLIAGVDKNESLTDVIMVGSFESSTGDVHILSVPRDTFITLEKEKLNKLKAIGKSAPRNMKINAINVYAGEEYGMEFLKSEVEEILGVKIDYYVKVDLEGFRAIVDTIGGVEFDVPAGGLYYSDPTQNLYINLRGGKQLLNGKDAEGLVRFRKGYVSQDIQRTKVQQDFLKEFVKQLLQKETIKSNLVDLVSNFFKYVDTNFKVDDMAKYVSVIDKISADKIVTDTLPGEPTSIDGISYFMFDQKGTKELVNVFFYGEEPENEESTNEQIEESDNDDN